MLASETRKLAREALQGKWGKAALTILVYTLLTAIISAVLSLIPIAGPIAQLVIQIPLTFGLVATLIKLKRGEDTTYTEFFTNGFNNFVSSWKVALWTCVKLLAPIILGVACVILITVGTSIGIATAAEAQGLTIPSSMTSAQLESFINTHDLTSNFGSTATILIALGSIGIFVASIWATIKSYLYRPVYFLLFDNPEKKAKAIVEESAKVMNGNRWKWFCLELSFIGWMILAGFTFGIGMLWLIPYIFVAQIVFYEFLFGKKEGTVEVAPEEPQVEE